MNGISCARAVSTMDFDNLVLHDTKNLNCSLCNNCLSHFPIYISGDKHNICNRCYNLLPEKSNYVQNEAYETVAQFVQFPCCYRKEGCLEKFLPVNISQHEKACSYRVIKCPTVEFTECTWDGALPNVLHHCQDKHFDVMLKNGEFQIDLSRSHQCENLLEHDSLLFIISTNFFAINKCLEFSIFNIASESSKNVFTCEITFKNGNRNLSIKCDTTAFTEKKITEIFLNSLKDRDNESSIVVAKISLETAKEQHTLSIDDKINVEFLNQLKCIDCGEYAMPPIYQDLNQPIDNQIRCYDCCDKITSFGSSSKGLRNINLDKIASLLNYPCKYDKNGCNAIYKHEEMKKHRLFCPFGKHVCPVSEYVGCKWSGLGKDVAAHIEASHQGMIKTNSTEISECVFNTLNSFNNSSKSSLFGSPNSNKSNSIKCYIIQFAEHLFQLNFSEIDQNYYWTVQLIGQLQNNYMYELEIIDKNNKSKLLIRQPCTSLRSMDKLFTLKNSYCYFQKNQIESFVCGQIITFKVTIYK